MALTRSKTFKLISIPLMLFALTSCEDDATAPPDPILTTIAVSLSATALTVGQSVQATAEGLDQNGDPIAIEEITWSTTAGDKANVAADGMVTAIAEGDAMVLATVAGRSGQQAVTVAASPGIIINEVESNGGTPGDWVEIYNPTSAAADISGWVFKDNDNTHIYTLPLGTTIASGGYFVLEEAAFGFGLGAAESARLFSQFGVLIASHEWTAHAPITYGRCPNTTGVFTANTTSTKGAANDCTVPILVRINEVESNGGTPGDWIELFNTGTAAADLSGFIVRDNNDAAGFTLPAGTLIGAGAYLVVEEAAFGFGLGGADAARLFSPGGTLIDSYTWTAHATTTYGRCPNATGAFETTVASTKGAANSCAGQATTAPWPGADDAVTVDGAGVFTSNLSGLTYEGAAGANPAVLWAVVNGPGTLFRLVWNGAIWTPDAANNWGVGKALRYPGGTGNPDSEGVTFANGGAATGLYVATERNNDASTISKSSVLRFDPTAAGATLTATNEWNLTADLPVVGANLGIEAITWIPDTYLVSKNFFDESAGHTYNPAEYANHGDGLFFVGVEGNGIIYVYALNHVSNAINRIATIQSTFTGVMGLEFDRELNYLWATCDDTCGTKAAVLEIDTRVGLPTSGRMLVTRIFDRPASLPNVNNEGFTLAPQSECVAGRKPAFWSDDNGTGGHALRRVSITCVPF